MSATTGWPICFKASGPAWVLLACQFIFCAAAISVAMSSGFFDSLINLTHPVFVDFYPESFCHNEQAGTVLPQTLLPCPDSHTPQQRIKEFLKNTIIIIRSVG